MLHDINNCYYCDKGNCNIAMQEAMDELKGKRSSTTVDSIPQAHVVDCQCEPCCFWREMDDCSIISPKPIIVRGEI